MADGRELRKKQQVNYKESSKASQQSKSKTEPVSKTGVKSKPSLPRSSITARLSSSSQSPLPITKREAALSDTLTALESRVSVLETRLNNLSSKNADLKLNVATLESEIQDLKTLNNRYSTPHRDRLDSQENNTSSIEQREINCNLVIRGVDVDDSTDLTAIYKGIRDHLGVSNVKEFDPISFSVIPSKSPKSTAAARPIKVVLQSVDAKVKFLQIRRTKKDILHSDIGITDNSRRSVLITEQLTRANQELLYHARSLRERGNFKFVWSKNGEVLARFRQNSRVIRITDKGHVNSLRSHLKLEPLSDDGRFYTKSPLQLSTSTASA